MSFRIGFGYDVHRLEEGLPFHLAGIKITHYKGAVGHSDGDVLIHALCDAMLGAAALGDIGQHFPDSDESLRNIDSKILLKKTSDLIRKEGFAIENIDSTISLQQPKISPYIPQMRSALSDCLEIDVNAISIKATTEEKLGFTGREEGVAAYAVVLLCQQ